LLAWVNMESLNTAGFTILHISDTHFISDDDPNRDAVLRSLLKRVSELAKSEWNPDMILCTGDIAFSGKPNEYEPAKRFFDQLLQATAIKTKKRLFVVPGNHDADCDKMTSLHEKCITNDEDSDEFFRSQDTLKTFLEKFNGYQKFCCDYLERSFDEKNHYFADVIEIKGFKVGVVGLNSAWLSDKADKGRRQQLLGKHPLADALQKLDGADLKITMFHHPWHWLLEFEQRRIKTLLAESVDLVLNGHQYKPDIDCQLSQAEPKFGQERRILFIQAGPAHASKPWPNRIHFIRWEIQNSHKIVKVYPLKFDPEVDEWILDSTLFTGTGPDHIGCFDLGEFKIPSRFMHPSTEKLVNELKGELLKEDLLSSPASQEEIFDFYCGAPLSWRTIAANGDIRRNQEAEIMGRALQEGNNLQIICIVSEPGAGKTTVAWRIAYELFRRNELVLHFYNDNPDVWYNLSQLAEYVNRHFYVLIDDIFRNREFVKALQNITKDNLPVTVLATARSAEYREAGLERFMKKIELRLDESEKKDLLDKLGKSYQELPPNVQRVFNETELFLVLGMALTKGKHFDRIICDIIESLLEGDEKYHDALYRAYEYVCFSYSHGFSIPKQLLSNLDQEGRFNEILLKERAKGVFYEDSRPQYPTSFIRAGHQLIAEKALELYSRVFSGRSAEVLFKEILEAANEQDSIQRWYVAHLVRALLSEKKEGVKSIEDVFAKSEKISRSLSNATISELNIWRSVYKQLNREKEVEKCSEEILSREPIIALDCQLLVSELLNRGDKNMAFEVINAWLKEHPDDGMIFSRYVSFVREKADEKLTRDIIGKTSEWLKDHPNDKNVLEAFLTLVRTRGSQEQIKKAIEETTKWLTEHPDDNKVRESFLVLVREKGEQEQVEKAINETASWLKNHPEDKKIRSVYLSLVRDRGFLRLEDIKRAVDDAEGWMEKYGPHPLFPDYLTLVKKVRKSEIGIETNAELIKQLGYMFTSSCNWEDSILLIDSFARWLSEEKFFGESEQIYDKLSKMEIHSKKVKSDVYFGYGMLFISQAINQKLTYQERLEKLKKAEERFKVALENVKGHLARAYLGISLWEQKRFKEAEKEFKHAEWWARNVPTTGYSPGKLFFEIGKFYLEFDRFKEAKFWYEKATEEEPRNFANWWGLAKAKIGSAIILKKQGMVVEAKDLFFEALSDLEKAVENAPHPLQLPASRDVPNQISQCKKYLSNMTLK